MNTTARSSTPCRSHRRAGWGPYRGGSSDWTGQEREGARRFDGLLQCSPRYCVRQSFLFAKTGSAHLCRSLGVDSHPHQFHLSFARQLQDGGLTFGYIGSFSGFQLSPLTHTHKVNSTLGSSHRCARWAHRSTLPCSCIGLGGHGAERGEARAGASDSLAESASCSVPSVPEDFPHSILKAPVTFATYTHLQEQVHVRDGK
jgi:hypothetical protein